MISILDVVVVALAAGALVNAWLHSGGLFEGFRDWLGVLAVPRNKPWHDWFWERLHFLLTCRVCLTYHAAFWLLVLFCATSHLWTAPLVALIVRTPIYALAAARISLMLGSLIMALGLEGDPEAD